MPNYQEKPRRAAIVSTQPVYGVEVTKDGQRLHKGTLITDEDGVTKTLLTPAGKTAKAAQELRMGVKLTNEGEVKLDTRGNIMMLTKEERAYRAGRLDQARDSAKCHNAIQAKKTANKKK